MTGDTRSSLRNIAIIAHVDHGKTTLVDKLFRFGGTIKESAEERVMDSNDLERERGITILAKNTGVRYGDFEINIVDTPGHSDFGGEVERTLQMVEGFLLLVDAAEGVLPGTRFVLGKALQLNLRPIVVINKIDRKDADIARTESLVHDLFLDLATSEDQLDFPILYGSGRMGIMSTSADVLGTSMQPLFDAIVKTIPAPVSKADNLQMLITNLDYSDYLGIVGIGRLFSGSLSVGQQVICCKDAYVSKPTKITKIYKFLGLERIEVPTAQFGDIVAVTGFTEPLSISTTLCEVGIPLPYPYVTVDEPTVSITISVNDSPLNGRDGKLLTSRQIRERLEKEAKTNVALRVEPTDSPDEFKVSGRGQLHLGILIETMRREGFELQISAPEVIYKTIDGVKCEPIEYLVVDIQAEHQGTVMEFLSRKRAEMKQSHHYENGRMRLEFEVPSRGLFGFRSRFLTETRGTGIATFSFLNYQPVRGQIPLRTRGALVSMEAGSATSYALETLQQRGIMFVKPGDIIYEGMIIGENSREGDMDVNPCKLKKLTNMRAAGCDDTIKLEPPRMMPLEICMEWIMPDELLEITPNAIRLRKKILRATFRK